MTVQRKRLIASKILTSLVVISMFISVGNSNAIFDILGFILMVTAGVGRIWASAYISGFKSGKVVKDGPYSIMRNPLYFFSFLGFVGAGLTFGSIVLTIMLIGTFMITHIPTILSEEKKLEGLFGDEYRKYIKSVPRFFPNFSKFYNPEEIQFYPKKFTKTLIEATYLIFGYGAVKLILWLHEIGVLPTLWINF